MSIKIIISFLFLSTCIFSDDHDFFKLKALSSYSNNLLGEDRTEVYIALDEKKKSKNNLTKTILVYLKNGSKKPIQKLTLDAEVFNISYLTVQFDENNPILIAVKEDRSSYGKVTDQTTEFLLYNLKSGEVKTETLKFRGEALNQVYKIGTNDSYLCFIMFPTKDGTNQVPYLLKNGELTKTILPKGNYNKLFFLNDRICYTIFNQNRIIEINLDNLKSKEIYKGSGGGHHGTSLGIIALKGNNIIFDSDIYKKLLIYNLNVSHYKVKKILEKNGFLNLKFFDSETDDIYYLENKKILREKLTY